MSKVWGNVVALAVVPGMLLLGGCATPEEGAVVGAVTGAAVGILAAGAGGGHHGGGPVVMPGPGHGPRGPGPRVGPGGPGPVVVGGHHHGGADPLAAGLIGAATGAVIGGMIGQQNKAQTETNARLNAAEQAAQQQTVWVTNSNGSRTPVLLRQGSGGTWTGPKGESYMSLPTGDQLRSVYGF